MIWIPIAIFMHVLKSRALKRGASRGFAPLHGEMLGLWIIWIFWLIGDAIATVCILPLFNIDTSFNWHVVAQMAQLRSHWFWKASSCLERDCRIRMDRLCAFVNHHDHAPHALRCPRFRSGAGTWSCCNLRRDHRPCIWDECQGEACCWGTCCWTGSCYRRSTRSCLSCRSCDRLN